MIFYIATVDTEIEGEAAYATLKEAKANRDPGTKIRKITTPRITRELACALFNRAGYAANQEEVA